MRLDPRTYPRPVLAVGATALAALAAACGSTQPAASSSTAKPAAQPRPAAVEVKTATAGTLGTVLVDGSGMTLYRFTAEKPGAIACTGACVSNWPPLLLPGGSTAAQAGPGVSGLGTTARPDGGTQVTYQGAPLYHYSKDTAPGDTNGQGFNGKWFVVQPGAAPTSQTGSQTTATTAAPYSGGY